MNEIEVGYYWNNNALGWTLLSRAGHDIYRDYLNTPAFFFTQFMLVAGILLNL